MTTGILKSDDPTLLKLTTKDDEKKELKYNSEKHDREKNLKSPIIDKHYYTKDIKV